MTHLVDGLVDVQVAEHGEGAVPPVVDGGEGLVHLNDLYPYPYPYLTYLSTHYR